VTRDARLPTGAGAPVTSGKCPFWTCAPSKPRAGSTSLPLAAGDSRGVFCAVIQNDAARGHARARALASVHTVPRGETPSGEGRITDLGVHVSSASSGRLGLRCRGDQVRGASRGAIDCRNVWRFVTQSASWRPSCGAESRGLTISGNAVPVPGKQELPGSSPGAPIPEGRCLMALFVCSARTDVAAESARGAYLMYRAWTRPSWSSAGRPATAAR
jgi:hypothetical protein